MIESIIDAITDPFNRDALTGYVGFLATAIATIGATLAARFL